MTIAADEYSGAAPCSLANAVQVVGERWTFFVLREALVGVTRFGEFRTALGIASDVLAARLDTLVDAGIMQRRPYRDPGQRPRDGYHLTEGGRRLALVVLALQEWGDAWTPSSTPTSVRFLDADDSPVRPAFVDVRGEVVDPDAVRAVR